MKGSGHGLQSPRRSSWPICRIPGLPALQDGGGEGVYEDGTGVSFSLGIADWRFFHLLYSPCQTAWVCGVRSRAAGI